MKFESLSNVRPTKDLGCQLIASPTSGQIKVTPEAATALKVGNEDFVEIIKGTEEVDGEQVTTIFACKGEPGRGNKLASSNKGGGGILTFSGATAWEDLQGDTNYNTHFNMKTGEGDVVEYQGRSLFPLEFDEKIEKIARKRKAKSDVSADASVEDVQEDSQESVEASDNNDAFADL